VLLLGEFVDLIARAAAATQIEYFPTGCHPAIIASLNRWQLSTCMMTHKHVSF
jgi:hypothetical protein